MTSTFSIMAAVDLSDFSPAIVRYSVWLSQRLGADLLVVNVINQRDIDIVQRAMASHDPFSIGDYITDQKQDRTSRLGQMLSSASPGIINCRTQVHVGIPYQELLKAIEREKPNLMVVGTKGRSNFADVVVGSTARKMYRRSPIPLLAIPPGSDEPL